MLTPIGWWVAGGAASLGAALLPSPATDSLLTVASYLDFERVSDPAISPDGKVIVYTRSWIDRIDDHWESGAAQWTYDLDLGCNMGRTDRFQVKKFDANDNLLGDYWYYNPSTRGSTNETAFSLGDLNRFF
jgi:hypothetical protein